MLLPSSSLPVAPLVESSEASARIDLEARHRWKGFSRAAVFITAKGESYREYIQTPKNADMKKNPIEKDRHQGACNVGATTHRNQDYIAQSRVMQCTAALCPNYFQHSWAFQEEQLDAHSYSTCSRVGKTSPIQTQMATDGALR